MNKQNQFTMGWQEYELVFPTTEKEKEANLIVTLERNVARLESAIEALAQSQPGMPALPKVWREWFERQAKAVIVSDKAALSKVGGVQ